MGQRHQLFIIARINGKYRTLAAVHHQWLYGHTALRRCLGTLQILQDEQNRVPLAEELKIASKRDEELWKAPESRNIIEVHFPFIMTCLILGASFSQREGYFHDVNIEPFHMSYDEGDNNNGELTSPALLDPFLTILRFRTQLRPPVQLMTPLSARTYLEAYYELDNPEFTHLLGLVEQFRHWTLIDVAALEDMWPGQDWQESEHQSESSYQHCEPDVSKLSIPAQDDSTSLRARTLDQLVKSIVNEEQIDPESLSHAMMLTDFYPKMKDELYKQAEKLRPSPDLMDWLFTSLKGDEYVDLSPFTAMPHAEISSLAIRLIENGCVKDLNLSGWNVADQDLCTMLGHERIRRLFLMRDDQVLPADVQSRIQLPLPYLKFSMHHDPEAPGSQPQGLAKGPQSPFAHRNLFEVLKTSYDFGTAALCIAAKSLTMICSLVPLSTLASAKPTGDLYHHDLLRRPLLGECDSFRGQPPLPLLDFSAPADAVVQLVWVRLHGDVFVNPACCRPDGGIAWDKLKPDMNTHTQFSFGFAEKEPMYRKFPLVDVPMSLLRMVTGLSNLLQWIFHNDSRSVSRVSKCMANSFAVGALPSDTLCCGIGPLSTELYWNEGRHGVQLQGLKPGQWAIILIHDHYDALDQSWIDKIIKPKIEESGRSPDFPLKKQVRYALVAPAKDSTDRFIVANVPKFLELSSNRLSGNELGKWWKKHDETHDELQFYGDKDIQDILAKVYE
ncbi:MAG: hypothetical protein Q9217_006673 [Psora testacea]